MIFVTETGSTYQIDFENKQFRRMTGKTDPTARTGKDGEWKPYIDLIYHGVGKSVIIQWGWNPDDSAACTMTSRVAMENPS